MIAYADDSSVRDARAQYFVANGFSDAGYTDDWVKSKLGPFPFTFPNAPTQTRKRAPACRIPTSKSQL